MKMRKDHYQYLKSRIDNVLSVHNSKGELIACYEYGNFASANKVKSLQRRFCFDVLFGAGLNQWVCTELYSYLDDTHIYTALKHICPTVTRKY